MGMPTLVQHGARSLPFRAAADQSTAAYTDLVLALNAVENEEGLEMASTLLASGYLEHSDGLVGLLYGINLSDAGRFLVYLEDSGGKRTTNEEIDPKHLGQWLLDHREQKEIVG